MRKSEYPADARRALFYLVTVDDAPRPGLDRLEDDAFKGMMLKISHTVSTRKLRWGFNFWPANDRFNQGGMLRIDPFILTVRRRRGRAHTFHWPWWMGWEWSIDRISDAHA